MADISTANLDSGSDSPALARVQLLAAVQRVNVLTADTYRPVARYVRSASELSAALTAGGVIRIPDGVYAITSQMQISYTSNTFPAWGQASPRVDLIGDSTGNTILSYSGASGTSCLYVVGEPTATYQGVHGLDRIEALSIVRASGSGGIGLHMYGKAYTVVRDLFCQGWEIGWLLNGVLSASIENVVSRGNTNGAAINYSGTALLPNAISIKGCGFATNSNAGLLWSVCGVSNVLEGGAVENNGTTGGSGGGALINVTGLNGTHCLTVRDVYFEANGGLADLSIDNIGSTDVSVTIDGCVFNRLLSSRYTVNNIRATSSGGGRLRVIVRGCGFLSDGSYVPSASRYYMVASGNAEIIDGGGNTYSETTSLGENGTNWPCAAGSVYAGRVDAAGGIIAGAPDISVTRSSAGVYTIVKAAGFGRTVHSYIAQAVSNDTAGGQFVERVVQISETTFQVVTRNTAGALVDIAFSWTVARLA